MKFSELFSTQKPLIACIHLLALPSSPRYGGSMKKIIETAVREAEVFSKNGIDSLIVSGGSASGNCCHYDCGNARSC
jgi:predicted TIM-barrel enzyme